MNPLREYYFLLLAALSAKVEITLPNVSKLYEGQRQVRFVEMH